MTPPLPAVMSLLALKLAAARPLPPAGAAATGGTERLGGILHHS
jgi:hypothetical protein